MWSERARLACRGASATTFAVLGLVAFCSLSAGAPINYGDFSDIPPGSVMYSDVTESANSPGDIEPLFGPPAITADRLDFDPAIQFSASGSGGGVDPTSGSISADIDAGGLPIQGIDLRTSGFYGFSGSGSKQTATEAAASFASVLVVEIDGVPAASPLVLPVLADSVAFDAVGASEPSGPWAIDLQYDLDAALRTAGVSFQRGATRLSIGMNIVLNANSEALSDASVGVQAVSLEAIAGVIPEPGSSLLLAAAFSALSGARCRVVGAAIERR